MSAWRVSLVQQPLVWHDPPANRARFAQLLAPLDYDPLIDVANWPAARAEAWRQLLPARAIENQAFVAGVNRVGRDGLGVPYAGDSAVMTFGGSRWPSLATRWRSPPGRGTCRRSAHFAGTFRHTWMRTA